jgi:hypothetical protein
LLPDKFALVPTNACFFCEVGCLDDIGWFPSLLTLVIIRDQAVNREEGQVKPKATDNEEHRTYVTAQVVMLCDSAVFVVVLDNLFRREDLFVPWHIAARFDASLPRAINLELMSEGLIPRQGMIIELPLLEQITQCY